MSSGLSAEQIAAYRRDGYVSPIRVMPTADAAALRREMEAVESAMAGCTIWTSRSW